MKIAKRANTNGNAIYGVLRGCKLCRVSTSGITRSICGGNSSILSTLSRTFNRSVLGPSNATGETGVTRGTFSSTRGARGLGDVIRPTIARGVGTVVGRRDSLNAGKILLSTVTLFRDNRGQLYSFAFTIVTPRGVHLRQVVMHSNVRGGTTLQHVETRGSRDFCGGRTSVVVGGCPPCGLSSRMGGMLL